MPPLILLTPHTAPAGAEMPDPVISLSRHYFDAILDAGGLPLALPLTDDVGVLDAAVAGADGVMLTGGDDIDPQRYWPGVPAEILMACACAEPLRDSMELELVGAVLRRRKPLLAICRGHQIFNVALGGTLYADLPSQRPGEVNHNQMALRLEKAHTASILPNTQLAAITGLAEFGVNTTHHQAIDRLGEGLRASALGPDGVIEAAEFTCEAAGRLPWFASVQFHPERLYKRHPEHGRIFQAFVAACRRP